MNATKRKPFTAGEILREEFMEPLNLTQTKLAELTGMSRCRINEIINNKRFITLDTSIRLAKLFKTSPAYWLNLQIEEHNNKIIAKLIECGGKHIQTKECKRKFVVRS